MIFKIHSKKNEEVKKIHEKHEKHEHYNLMILVGKSIP